MANYNAEFKNITAAERAERQAKICGALANGPKTNRQLQDETGMTKHVVYQVLIQIKAKSRKTNQTTYWALSREHFEDGEVKAYSTETQRNAELLASWR